MSRIADVEIAGQNWTNSMRSQQALNEIVATSKLFSDSVAICWKRNNRNLYSLFMTMDLFWAYYVKVEKEEKTFYWVDTSRVDPLKQAPLMVPLQYMCEHHNEVDMERIQGTVELVDESLHAMGMDKTNRNFSVDIVRLDNAWYTRITVTYPHIIFDDTSVNSMGMFVQMKLWPSLQLQNDFMYSVTNNSATPILIPDGFASLEFEWPHYIVYGSKSHTSKACFTPTYDDFSSSCPNTQLHSNTTIIYNSTPLLQLPCETATDSVSTYLCQLLQSRGGNNQVVVKRLNIYGTYLCIGMSHCVVSKDCDCESCYISVCNDRLYGHCTLDTTIPGEFIGIMGKPLVVKWTDDDVFVGQFPTYDTWDPDKDVLINERDNEYIQPILLDFGRRVVVVSGGMGQGKTSRAKELTAAIGNSKRVLVVLSRRSLTWALYHAFDDFEHYSQKNFLADKLIIEYESLHYLAGCEQFDLILIDEIRSVASTIKQKTNGRYMQVNCNILVALCRASYMTVCLGADAEIDNVVPFLLHTIFPQISSIQVERYTVPKIIRKITICSDEIAWDTTIQTYMDDNQKTAICCRTKRRANEFALTFSKRYPFKKVVVLSSDTGDDEIQRVMADVNAYLADVDLFIFTSKLNIGIDITLLFSRVYVDGIGQGCQPRDLMQMIGRFREIEYNNILVLVSSLEIIHITYEKRLQQCKDELLHRHTFIRSVNTMMTHDVQFVDGYLTLAPNWISKLFMYCAVETKSQFLYELIRLCKFKKWPVHRTDFEDNTEKVEDFEVSRIECKDIDKKRKKLVFDELYPASDIARLAAFMEADKRVALQTSDVHDRDIIETYTIIRYWSELTFDQFQHAQKQMKQLRNLTKTAVLNNEQLLRLELNTLHKHEWSDHTLKSEIIQYKCMHQCSRLLGLDSIFDGDTHFYTETLATHEDAISTLCRKASVASNRNNKSRGMSGEVQILTMLRRELREVYGIKIKKVGRSPRGAPATYKLSLHEDSVDLAARSHFGYSDLGTTLPDLIGITDIHNKKDMTKLLLPSDDLLGLNPD
jgi:hypothetical protein